LINSPCESDSSSKCICLFVGRCRLWRERLKNALVCRWLKSTLMQRPQSAKPPLGQMVALHRLVLHQLRRREAVHWTSRVVATVLPACNCVCTCCNMGARNKNAIHNANTTSCPAEGTCYRKGTLNNHSWLKNVDTFLPHCNCGDASWDCNGRNGEVSM
jgi:hypothetical protein